jgi:hypothetical protein
VYRSQAQAHLPALNCSLPCSFAAVACRVGEILAQTISHAMAPA